jgi:hypothetical protein
MSTPNRHVLLGMVLGAFTATVLAATGPGVVLDVMADEAPQPAFDPADLVRFGDREYRVHYEDWVATEPLSSASVKKIEAGRVSFVTITTTETGTYSTDGLTSPHVQYPGIEVAEVTDGLNDFRFWTNGYWQSFRVGIGDSFRYYSDGRVSVGF